GGIAGALLGGGRGALIGAGIGAVAGGAIGNSMDRQDADLRQYLQSSGVQVQRVGNDIRLIMPGDITFANNSANIRSNFYSTLNSIAIVLRKYRHTVIRIAGYTSNTGSYQYNQVLSEQRARAVGSYLIAQGINPNRVSTKGYGKRHPIASNAT